MMFAIVTAYSMRGFFSYIPLYHYVIYSVYASQLQNGIIRLRHHLTTEMFSCVYFVSTIIIFVVEHNI